jgi:hypothetical protein
MILPDVNLLVHAYNTQFPQHEKAKAWWEDKLDGPTSVALAWVTILGFIRVTTHPRILRNPLTVQEAIAIVEDWLELPHFFLVLPSSRHFPVLRALFLQLGTAGNLTTDVHLAALAIERGLVLHSTDADFGRFEGLKWVNPIRLYSTI